MRKIPGLLPDDTKKPSYVAYDVEADTTPTPTNQREGLPPLAQTPTDEPPPLPTRPRVAALPPLSPRQQAEQELNQSVSAPLEPVKGWQKGLYLALQTINKITNPQDQTPIQWDLAQARKDSKIQQAQRKLAPLQQNEDWNTQNKLKQAQIGVVEQQPSINQQKIDITQKGLENKAKSADARAAIAQYKNIPELDLNTPEGQAFAKEFEDATGLPALPKNAKTSSKYYFSEDGNVYLTKSDEQGNTIFSQVVNDDGTPQQFETKGMRSSQDKELDRKFKGEEGKANRTASITRAQIMAQAQVYGINTRAKTAVMEEQGRNQRQSTQIQVTKEANNRLMEQRRVAEQNKNTVEVQRIDNERKRAMAYAKGQGYTDEQIKEMFGGNQFCTINHLPVSFQRSFLNL